MNREPPGILVLGERIGKVELRHLVQRYFSDMVKCRVTFELIGEGETT